MTIPGWGSRSTRLGPKWDWPDLARLGPERDGSGQSQRGLLEAEG